MSCNALQPLPDTAVPSTARPPDSTPALDPSSWTAVDYCGFLRLTYEPGTLHPATVVTVANAAYARLAGLANPEELADQCPPCGPDPQQRAPGRRRPRLAVRHG
jgi:hypothetical protein